MTSYDDREGCRVLENGLLKAKQFLPDPFRRSLEEIRSPICLITPEKSMSKLDRNWSRLKTTCLAYYFVENIVKLRISIYISKS